MLMPRKVRHRKVQRGRTRGAAKGGTQLAFGDLVGSNISNIGLILGIAAIIRPLKINMRLKEDLARALESTEQN